VEGGAWVTGLGKDDVRENEVFGLVERKMSKNRTCLEASRRRDSIPLKDERIQATPTKVLIYMKITLS
jgi:hypothetical protein